MTCACGCGKPVGKRKGSRYAPHHSARSRPRSVWFADWEGRWRVSGRDGRSYVWARVVLENERGRELSPDEIVHHHNRDCGDDRVENLELTTQSEHMRGHHARGESYVPTDADRAKAIAASRLPRETTDLIVLMWRNGFTSAQIADAIGWQSPGAVRQHIGNLRERGYELPLGNTRKRRVVEAEATGASIRRAA